MKDALALLSFLLNPKDEVAFRRIVNKPTRGLGDKSVGAIVEASFEREGDLLRAAEDLLQSFSGKSGKGLEEFVSFSKELSKNLEEAELSPFLKVAFRKSGLLKHHREQDVVAGTQKVANLEELAAAAIHYPSGREGLGAFLEDLELDRARIAGKDPASEPGVTLITMHNTKGLEFDRVIITGMEEGLFPSRPDEKDDELEEERRILYVSITRAKRELYFSTCRRRTIWGRTVVQEPSRFLQEIPREHLKVIDYTEAGGESYGGGFQSAYPKSYPRAAGWRRGERVYHDEYGAGVVQRVEGRGNSTVLHVGFETGRKATFMPAYTELERIAEEEI